MDFQESNRLLQVTNKTLCTPGPRRREQWPQNRLTQTCLWVSRSLWQKPWPAAGSEALSAAVHAWDLLKEVTNIFIAFAILWPQVKQDHLSKENWIKDLLSMAPPIRTRLSFPLSQSLPSGSFHKPLILSTRGQTDWKPPSQKTNQSDHMDHSLV